MESTENNNNVEDIGQTKENKQEIERKVARILKIIKNNGQDKKGNIPEDSKRKSELIGLIYDFHKQYQKLHSQYDDLKGEVGIRGRGRLAKEESSSTPASASDYYSSEDIEDDVVTNRNNESSGNNQAQVDSEDSEASANMKNLTEVGKKNREHEGKREFSTLVKVQDVHGSRASAEVKELEGQLTMLRWEVESLRSLNNGLEVQIEEKESQVKRIGETNAQLHAQISELQSLSEEKGNEISAIIENMKENENKLTSRNQALVTQVKDLQLDIDYLRAEISEINGSKKNKKSTQVMSLKDQFKVMKQELQDLRGEKTELQLQLDTKTKGITENLSQIEALKDEIARKNGQEQGLLKEKEGFLVQMDSLKLEVNSLHDQNNELEEMIKNRKKETDELREKKDRLQDKVLQLQRNLEDKGDELSTAQKKKNEASTQIMAVKAQVKSLQQELDSLVGEKIKLEEQNVQLKQNSEQNLMQVENEILNLTSKIEDQKRTLKEKDDTIKKFTEENKLTKHHSLDLNKQRTTNESSKIRTTDSIRFNHNVFERKIDELAEKFHMKMENHIRLLSRRIRVAEQLHTEAREGCKMAIEKLEQENKELNEKKAACESEMKKTKDVVMELGSNMLTGVDTMIKKIDDENGNFLNRISRISDGLQLARNCVKLKLNRETEEAIKDAASKLGMKVEELEQKLKERDEVLSSLGIEKKEAINAARRLDMKLEELEQKLKERDVVLSSLGEEKNEAISAASELDMKVEELEKKLKKRDEELEQKLRERNEEQKQKLKEKDEILSSLGEEKREAIRQLCELIEYHRQRYANLTESVSKLPIRFKKQS